MNISLDYVTLRKSLDLCGPHFPHLYFMASRAPFSPAILSHYYYYKRKERGYAKIKFGICFVSRREKEILESENTMLFCHNYIGKDTAIYEVLLNWRIKEQNRFLLSLISILVVLTATSPGAFPLNERCLQLKRV